MDKLKLRQAIVVEGKYDQNKLRQIVDTAIFTTNGFADMKDPALLRLLQQAAQTTGLVILTDSDGAGFLIRNTLKSALPETGVLHAYIPDLPGKEKRKAAPGKEGLLGVEGMTPEILSKPCATQALNLQTAVRLRPQGSRSPSRTCSPSAFPAALKAQKSAPRF